MDDISELAARSGVAAEYYDAVGERRRVGRDALSNLSEAVGGDGPRPNRPLRAPVVVRQRRHSRVQLAQRLSGTRVAWEVFAGTERVASGAADGALELADIPVGTYQLR